MSTLTWSQRRARRGTRPYPIDDLARAMGLDPNDRNLTSQLCVRLGIDRSWVRRCRQDGGGLTAKTADHWATRAGLHADIVWPGWWDDPADTAPLPDEDDPPVEELEPITPEKLEHLRLMALLRRSAA